MITKVIQVKATDQKMAKNNSPYLEVIDQNDKKTSIFDQALWNLFQPNAYVNLTLEKQGNFWNVTKAEAVSDAATKATVEKPSEYSGEERGMWFKECGEMIRAGKFKADDEGNKALILAYYEQMKKVILGG